MVLPESRMKMMMERAENAPDKKLVEGDDYKGDCINCGSTKGIVVTYYDALPSDRTCLNCGKTY